MDRGTWLREVYGPFRAKNPERRDSFATSSGIELEPVYGPGPFPGEWPFLRGVLPTMYRGKLWTMRQYAGYGSAEESNARYRYLLDQGQTGLSVAFDLPTQIGFDPDHPLAAGEVGRVGVSIASLEDMASLFAGIPLERVSTSMTINATAPILLALYVALARQRGVDPAGLRGTTQNDILKEYIARGTYRFPPAASLRLVTDVLGYATAELPLWNPISISGYHIREAGATAAQEIAFTLANASAYVGAALESGLAVDALLPRLSFFFAAQNNLFEEVAKFRAARRLWAHIARDRYGARDPRSMALRFHTQTAGVTLTAQQPHNNIVRVTLQALAAILGGTQSLHTNSMDEALGLPTEEAATVALRTQQILAYESGVADLVDPLAGCYALEALTAGLEQAATGLLQRIEALGGALAAIERGWVAAQVAESAYRLQQEIERGERTVVGVNAFTEGDARPVAGPQVDPAAEARRVEQLGRLRARRDAVAVDAALARLRRAAQGDQNVMPALLQAVEAEATVGEICAVLEEVFGAHRPVEAA
jgi:methylmalonyl-CoA mutase N-terminal domain/subunit